MGDGVVTAVAPGWAVVEFRAMGGPCRIVAPTTELVERGRQLVEVLEHSWTRFRPDSELSRINGDAGRLSIVSRHLADVLAVAEHARLLTGGLFDIRCLDAVEAAGYRCSWDDGAPEHLAPTTTGVRPASELPFLELYPELPAVLVPEGCRIDLGGIGKGFAADLVVESLHAAGAERVQVELGGDVRVSGQPWVGDQWTVEVEDPYDRAVTVARLSLAGGAVATSSVLRRRWQSVDRVTHRLIDPRTMAPADTDLVAVTAVADAAWRAEVAAKCALIAGRWAAPEVLGQLSARALLFARDGQIVKVRP